MRLGVARGVRALTLGASLLHGCGGQSRADDELGAGAGRGGRPGDDWGETGGVPVDCIPQPFTAPEAELPARLEGELCQELGISIPRQPDAASLGILGV